VYAFCWDNPKGSLSHFRKMIKELEDKCIVWKPYIEFLDLEIDIVPLVITEDQDLWFARIYMINFGWLKLIT
jgi:hypothetical protein